MAGTRRTLGGALEKDAAKGQESGAAKGGQTALPATAEATDAHAPAPLKAQDARRQRRRGCRRTLHRSHRNNLWGHTSGALAGPLESTRTAAASRSYMSRSSLAPVVTGTLSQGASPAYPLKRSLRNATLGRGVTSKRPLGMATTADQSSRPQRMA